MVFFFSFGFLVATRSNYNLRNSTYWLRCSARVPIFIIARVDEGVCSLSDNVSVSPAFKSYR